MRQSLINAAQPLITVYYFILFIIFAIEGNEAVILNLTFLWLFWVCSCSLNKIIYVSWDFVLLDRFVFSSKKESKNRHIKDHPTTETPKNPNISVFNPITRTKSNIIRAESISACIFLWFAYNMRTKRKSYRPPWGRW